MDHLDELEAEAIYIMREVAAECEKPVMLYSIGKDSSVMLHLALKAFYRRETAFPVPACEHHMEVQGNDRVPRQGRETVRNRDAGIY